MVNHSEILDYLEDTAAYINSERKERILTELFFNSFRTLKGVYLFKNFDEYVQQLNSDKNEDKKEIYWNASYYEKLIDYIKISIAFETYNKASLLESGYLIHKIRKNSENKDLFELQKKGYPIKISDFLKVSNTEIDRFENKIYLCGFTDNFETITYSITLNDNYQKIIGLDNELCGRLKEINNNRNRLHFFTDFKGAFHVDSHIKKWRYIKDVAFDTIELKCKMK
jgi:hypothetical protein